MKLVSQLMFGCDHAWYAIKFSSVGEITGSYTNVSVVGSRLGHTSRIATSSLLGISIHPKLILSAASAQYKSLLVEVTGQYIVVPVGVGSFVGTLPDTSTTYKDVFEQKYIRLESDPQPYAIPPYSVEVETGRLSVSCEVSPFSVSYKKMLPPFR
jgi:hypothetical protein